MGYKSDVRAIIGFGEQVKYATFLSLMREATYEERGFDEQIPMFRVVSEESLDDGRLVYDDEAMTIRFGLDSTGWYDKDAFEERFDQLLQMAVDVGGAFRFTRIGEEDDDVYRNEEGDSDVLDELPYINISRSLAWGDH